MSPRKRAQPTRRPSAHRPGIPWLAIAGGLAVLVVAALLVRSLEIGAPGERVSVSGVGDHVAEGQPVRYADVPPAGGPHWPAAAPWGVSVAPVPDERVVHNLEHGGVVVSYRGLGAEDVNRLRALTLSYPRDRYGEVKMLVRPYDRVPEGTIVLTAWGWRDTLTAYDEARIRAFLDAHLNRCCEAVP